MRRLIEIRRVITTKSDGQRGGGGGGRGINKGFTVLLSVDDIKAKH